jgi:hypothetical protein
LPACIAAKLGVGTPAKEQRTAGLTYPFAGLSTASSAFATQLGFVVELRLVAPLPLLSARIAVVERRMAEAIQAGVFRTLGKPVGKPIEILLQLQTA